MSAQILGVSLLGVGTALRLKNHAWSTVKRLSQATNEYATPSPPCWRQQCRDSRVMPDTIVAPPTLRASLRTGCVVDGQMTKASNQ